MAIAFNLPSEREASEENFSRLNRLLTELYEVLCHILVARQPEVQETRRDRPFSDSDLERPTISGLPTISQTARRRPGSISTPPPPITLDSDLEDDVFVSPRSGNGNDPFASRTMDIFGSSLCGPRTPAGVLLSPRRERRFTFSMTSEKHWRDKGGTQVDEADGVSLPSDADEPDAPSPEPSLKDSTSSDSSIFSSIMPDKLSGSICTAVLFMLGWKLLSNNR